MESGDDCVRLVNVILCIPNESILNNSLILTLERYQENCLSKMPTNVIYLFYNKKSRGPKYRTIYIIYIYIYTRKI